MESLISFLTQPLISLSSSISLVTLPPMSPFLIATTIFILAIIVGYHVVWRVTPALHAPLMSMTNVISSVIVVGALMGIGSAHTTSGIIISALALFFICINISGGLVITQRMLEMFTSKKGK